MSELGKPRPQYKPLSDFEREICLRFAQARRFEKLTQAELADRLGVSRHQIANIEACRVPLKFWLGSNFCGELNVNQRWLATGEPPKSPYFQVNPEQIPPPRPDDTALFSGVFLGPLRDLINSRARFVAGIKRLETAADSLGASYEEAIERLLRFVVSKVPDSAHLDYITFLVKGTKEFLSSLQLGAGTKPLTAITEVGKFKTMKSPMANLLERLNKATSRPGAKSELAKKFGVPLSNVSQWLSGKREPGGGTTLKLLNWVEQQERQQKESPIVR